MGETKRNARLETVMLWGKCKYDPAYFIENFLQTFDKTKGTFVKFSPFPKQLEAIKSYKDNRYNIVLKYRQAGISTLTAAYITWLVSFASKDNPEKVLILANKRETAMEFLNKAKVFHSQLPKWISVDIGDTNSKQHVRFSNGCEIKAVATSADALRGYTPSLLILDEAAFIEGGQDVWAACQASLSTGGDAILVSTPNGYDPIYHTTYDGAKKGVNDFKIVEMRWYEDPRFNKGLEWEKEGEENIICGTEDLKLYEQYVIDGYKPISPWYSEMIRQMNGNMRLVNQEINCDFLGSGETVIDKEWIELQEKENKREPIRKEGIERELWIWKDPEPGKKYVMGVDVSTGQSDDFSAFSVICLDCEDGEEQVAEYYGKMPPDELANYVWHAGTRYNAYVIIDITGGVGLPTSLKLKEMGYTQLHYPNGDRNKNPGFNIDSNRRIVVSELEESVRTNRVKIRSERTIAEMTTFIFRNGRPDHMVGYHDDLLWGLAMGLYVANTTFKEIQKNKNHSAAIMDSWMTTTQANEHIDSIKPIGEKISLSTPPNNKPERMNERFPDPMHPFGAPSQDARHLYKEHGWLFGKGYGGRRV
tara:strand:- start:3515 stop:5284 length:1770 start_codon:yes stop_codon:yes gene_type:complete